MKDSHERLMDMLGGWESVVGHQPNTTQSEVDPIGDLYQEAGQKDMTDEEVKSFLIDKVFPVMCGKS